MVGVEIDFVVKDVREAINLYLRIFDVTIVEQSNLERGLNEVVFTLYDTRFHMLDENPAYHLHSPATDRPAAFWFNVTVNDIADTFRKALEAGCIEVQPLTEHVGMGVTNAIVLDPFGYIWMLHQVHEVVSYEDRIEYMTGEPIRA